MSEEIESQDIENNSYISKESSNTSNAINFEISMVLAIYT